MFKNKTLGIIFSLALLFIMGSVYLYFQKFVITSRKQSISCLSENEMADYPIDKFNSPMLPLTISVRNKNTKEEKFKFIITNLSTSYEPEIHKCNVYVMREFNYNPAVSKQAPGYSNELWRYSYDGEGTKLLILSEVDKNGVFKGNLSYHFSIDPTEHYIGLEKSYLFQPDYALVIKDINTKQDIFTLLLKDIVARHPSLIGSFGFNGWSKDGKYFWGNIFEGANVLAFFRVDSTTWKYDIFSAPDVTMGGDAFNPDLGYVTYNVNPAPWTGDSISDETYRQQWKKEGKKTDFYVYSLITKKQILLATFDDPAYFTHPKWISDTELQYTLPSGEKKVYKIEE